MANVSQYAGVYGSFAQKNEANLESVVSMVCVVAPEPASWSYAGCYVERRDSSMVCVALCMLQYAG